MVWHMVALLGRWSLAEDGGAVHIPTGEGYVSKGLGLRARNTLDSESGSLPAQCPPETNAAYHDLGKRVALNQDGLEAEEP
jgi:hypothetical protein